MDGQAVFAILVFCITVICSSICLVLLYYRRDKQPIKSRSPIWLAISIIIGQFQISIHLWNIIGLAECHFSRIFLYLAYSGYVMCIIVRCWKLHFAFNINKNKILTENYNTWFHQRKFYVSDKFLIPAFAIFCVLLCVIGLAFDAIDPKQEWKSEYPPCEMPFVPDLLVNGLIFFASLVTLVVFCYLLYGLEDGYQISKELKISISMILVFYTLCIVLSFAPIPVFMNGTFQTVWFVIIPEPVSAFIAVYWPIYQTFTIKWFEKDSVLAVPRQDLEDLYHFLRSTSGFGPFMRFLHTEFCVELLFLWRDIDEFCRQDDVDERRIKAKYIVEEYLDPEGHKYMTESEIFQEQAKENIKDPEIGTTIFNDLRLEVEKRLHAKFGRFRLSKFYSQYACGVTIQESLVSMGMQ